ncbi:MAG: serine/threonine-protein kinase [Polyangiaceae bacterium]
MSIHPPPSSRTEVSALRATAPASLVPTLSSPDEPAPASRRGLVFDDDEDPASFRPLADPLVGLTVADRYRLLAPIGSGGMGIVYKVEHTRISKLMAMKLLAGELSHNGSLVKRFKREAMLASRLSHPNTVQVFDFGQADGLTYLVMELVTGHDLARAVRNGPMSFARAARLIVQICSSLAEAHGLGIVHRDLKPENVLLVQSPDGRAEIAKVCDFGLAKLREAPELNDVTSQGAIVGTPYFMSPEQIRGEEVDHRTDIYSLGAVFYRLLTGVNPFLGPTPMAVFQKHLSELPVPPSNRAPTEGIPRAADEIILRALAKRTDQRFESVQTFQQAILEALGTERGSTYDVLLDSGQLRQLTQQIAGLEKTLEAGPVRGKEVATRDEVEEYERKLNRQRWVGRVLITGAVIGGAAVAARAFLAATAAPAFDGRETEPNNEAAKANEIPFGRSVSGTLGKRLSNGVSDRDFYAFEVPSGVELARLSTTALPNIPLCTWLYRAGQSEPIARYCTGAYARDFVVDALKVEPGRYLVAVMQDVDPYERETPLVYESISDAYQLDFASTAIDPTAEIEPNDELASASFVDVGAEFSGMLSFMRDVDVICPSKAAKASHRSLRWVIRDAVERPRDAGSVLEIATLDPMAKSVVVRVHRAGVEGKDVEGDVHSPWSSPTIQTSDAPASACLQLKLARDPWSSSAVKIPRAGTERYHVRLEPVP